MDSHLSDLDQFPYPRLASCKNTKEAWETLETTYKGNEQVREIKLQSLKIDFEALKVKDNEKIGDDYIGIIHLVKQNEILLRRNQHATLKNPVTFVAKFPLFSSCEAAQNMGIQHFLL